MVFGRHVSFYSGSFGSPFDILKTYMEFVHAIELSSSEGSTYCLFEL